MTVHIVVNENGQPKIVWSGAALFFLGIWAVCGGIPALGYGMAFRDWKLAGMALLAGLFIGCITFPMLLIQQYRTPVDQLPKRERPARGR
ncbi:hypothetical protein [Tuwongella immobilis]|uniref:Uncharacterized protein n=1 Tax=Tuwongella immobilis TaxID=692036 RepID=A0A6C2YW92_9BACT|nr:hypothetical protein [Tuwongella immobilis]VIP05724.1 unnamed protein product [Tuwongella immobilis]VTS08804.1 unnamed protein product [Tuwongella immobilis]